MFASSRHPIGVEAVVRARELSRSGLGGELVPRCSRFQLVAEPPGLNGRPVAVHLRCEPQQDLMLVAMSQSPNTASTLGHSAVLIEGLR